MDGLNMIKLPSGKHTTNMEHHHAYVNQRTQWPCSSSQTVNVYPLSTIINPY